MKYRRKPEHVEAVQLTQDAVTSHVIDKTPLPDGCVVTSYDAHPPTRQVHRAVVRLRNKDRDLVMPGDWIVRDKDGALSIVNSDLFETMYEVADEQHPEDRPCMLAQIIRAPYADMTGIRVIVDGEVIGTGDYGGEPEDNCEYRDYKWVKELLVMLAKKLGASASIEDVEVDGPTERAASEAYYTAMAAPVPAKETVP